MDVLIYIVQNALPVMIPLLLVALGGMFSERSGVINIALEGIMLVGAFIGTLFVFLVQGSGLNPQVILLIAMVVAAIAGALYALLLGVAAIHLKADQTISGTALNMLVPAFMLLICKMKAEAFCFLFILLCVKYFSIVLKIIYFQKINRQYKTIVPTLHIIFSSCRSYLCHDVI